MNSLVWHRAPQKVCSWLWLHTFEAGQHEMNFASSSFSRHYKVSLALFHHGITVHWNNTTQPLSKNRREREKKLWPPLTLHTCNFRKSRFNSHNYQTWTGIRTYHFQNKRYYISRCFELFSFATYRTREIVGLWTSSGKPADAAEHHSLSEGALYRAHRVTLLHFTYGWNPWRDHSVHLIWGT